MRRAAAGLSSALIGLAAALAVLGSASAAEPAPSATLTATTSCNGGGWKITWKLTTAHTKGADGVFSNVSFLVVSSEYDTDHHQVPYQPTFFVENGKVSGDGEFTDEWSLGRVIGQVPLSLTVSWRDGQDVHTADVSATANAPMDCNWPPPPSPSTPTPRTTTPDAPGTPPSASTSGSPAPGVVGGTAGGGGDGGLPVTGAAAGVIAAMAAALLAAGAVLVVLFRRRRVTFTP